MRLPELGANPAKPDVSAAFSMFATPPPEETPEPPPPPLGLTKQLSSNSKVRSQVEFILARSYDRFYI